jgi:formylglycine-generating enzyme required for sulfatase activity
MAEEAASPYGLLSTVGVLWQWTSSAYAPYPYVADAAGPYKVLRGGCFSNGRNIVRCANRYSEAANVALNTFGFRCAKDGP